MEQMRRLYFTTGSPFARAVRIVLDELGLDYERHEEITTPTVEERAKTGPTLQVPVLVDGEVHLWDSNVILDYLVSTYPNMPAPPDQRPFTEVYVRRDHEWEDKLTLATLQTLGTSTGVISQLQWAGVMHEDNDYADRCAVRVQHLLNWCEGSLAGRAEGFVEGVMSVQDVLLAVWVMFMENRPLRVEWRSPNRPKIAALHDRLQARPSFLANPILWWEPGVVGYDGDKPIFADR